MGTQPSRRTEFGIPGDLYLVGRPVGRTQAQVREFLSSLKAEISSYTGKRAAAVSLWIAQASRLVDTDLSRALLLVEKALPVVWELSRQIPPPLQVCQRHGLLLVGESRLEWIGTVGQLKYLYDWVACDRLTLKAFARRFVNSHGRPFSYKSLKNNPSSRLPDPVVEDLRKLGYDCY